MKTQKFLTMVVALMMVTGLTFAGETATSMAKKNLSSDIKDAFKNEISHWNNYFYLNDINKVKEDIQVSVYVNSDQSLTLIKVVSPNQDAKDFVKYMFNKEKIEGDQILVGKAYSFNLHLRYESN